MVVSRTLLGLEPSAFFRYQVTCETSRRAVTSQMIPTLKLVSGEDGVSTVVRNGVALLRVYPLVFIGHAYSLPK